MFLFSTLLGRPCFAVLLPVCTFIISGTTYPSTLADATPHSESLGFLAIMWLVGCAYFKQHMRAFQHCTPEALFNSFSESSFSNLLQQRSHQVQWLDEIREKIWSRAASQANELPSVDALCLHTRARETIHMDKARGAMQAMENTVQVLRMDHCGWRMNSKRLEMIWKLCMKTLLRKWTIK